MTADTTPPPAEQPREPLSIDVFQIVDDSLLAKNRTDGTGWALRWADLKRDWMERTNSKFAYRCLPLTMANQLGLFVTSPVGFTARWRGVPDRVEFTFDKAAETWRHVVTNHFAYGIVTWNTPYLFRTRPRGTRILVTGPANGGWKPDCQPLTGLLESDWMTMSFTMNWAILRPNVDVRFEAGEPLFQVIPLSSDPCKDIENARVVLRRLDDDPAVAVDYRTWVTSRETFHRMQAEGAASKTDWQKHYFRGVTLEGSAAPTDHYTKIDTPEIIDETVGARPPVVAARPIVGPALRATSPQPAPGASSFISTSFHETPVTIARRDPRFAAVERSMIAALAAGGEVAPTSSVIPAGGFKLKVWRVHPDASRVTRAGDEPPADAGEKPTFGRESKARSRASAIGFWLFPPADLDVTWSGGDRYEHVGRGLDDEDRPRMEAIGVDLPYDPPRKLAFGADGEGIVTIWTGLIAETPPGWMLAVRDAGASGARVLEDIIASDEGPREIVVKLRVEAGKPLSLRAREPWPPLAQLVPMRREGVEEEWMLSQMPLGKSAKDAEEIFVKWMAGRSTP